MHITRPNFIKWNRWAGIILGLFLLSSHFLSAQTSESKVLVRNAGTIRKSQVISVKWYSREIYYEEGINIYRSEGDEGWNKLNFSPIRKLESLPDTSYINDPDLNFFIPLINETAKDNLKGFFLINVLVKSFQSESFSRFLGIQFEDTNVIRGKSYRYKVMALRNKSEVLIGESLLIKAGTEKPEAPIKEILLRADTNKVKITWKLEEQRFFAVNIYRKKEEEAFAKINKVPVMISGFKDSLGKYHHPRTFFTDDSLNVGTYIYQLAGVDFFGKQTEMSEQIRVEVRDLVPPPAPIGLKDSINGLHVTLSWKNNKTGDTKGINIYRSVKSDGPFIKVNSKLLAPVQNLYTDMVDHPGPYYYYIASVDGAGNEGKSNPVFSQVHDIFPPSKPLDVTIKTDSGKIYLTWKANKESDLLGYRIYRGINRDDKNFVLLNSGLIKEPRYLERLPGNARNRFYYKIVTLDSSYNRSEASETVWIQMPDIVPPVRPRIKNIKNIDKAIFIEWLPNKDYDLAGYEIYRRSAREPQIKVNKEVIPADVQGFTDTNCPYGVAYSYFLIAVDSAGNRSQPSSYWEGVNNFFSLNAEKVLADIRFRVQKNSIKISWKSLRPDDLIGFMVYRKENELDRFTALSSQISKTTFKDKDLKKGNSYFYEIRAYDKYGNIIRSAVKIISI